MLTIESSDQIDQSSSLPGGRWERNGATDLPALRTMPLPVLRPNSRSRGICIVLTRRFYLRASLVCKRDALKRSKGGVLIAHSELSSESIAAPGVRAVARFHCHLRSRLVHHASPRSRINPPSGLAVRSDTQHPRSKILLFHHQNRAPSTAELTAR